MRRSRYWSRILLPAAIMGSSLVVPGLSAATPARDDPGRGTRQQPEPCEQLGDNPGRAEGLERRCQEGSSSGVSRGDFNGDGFADLAIGTPFKDSPSTVSNSGGVYVIYGSATGLVPAGTDSIPPTQFWAQDTPGVPGSSNPNDNFGAALAAGSFDGDKFSDLAIGIPNDDVGGYTDTGRVVVLRGSQAGLTATNAQSFNLPDICSRCFSGDAAFGSALSWGDFDGDTVGDLAIGSPGEQRVIGSSLLNDVGAVRVLFGVRGAGLSTNGVQSFVQGSSVGDRPEQGDRFGEVLAAGNFFDDADGVVRSDLAVSAPGEDIEATGAQDAGAVHLLVGTSSGLQGDDVAPFTGYDFPTPARDPAFELFGSSLAVGDFDGQGVDDLAIGAPRSDAGGLTHVGAVFLLDMRPGGAIDDLISIVQGDLRGETTESGDRFGQALAPGDFNGDGFDDLAIGVPFEDVDGVTNAGLVNVIPGSSGGLVLGSSQQFRQGAGGMPETPETDDRFGRTLSAWNFGRNEVIPAFPPNLPRVIVTADLAIGVPFEDIVLSGGAVAGNAGAVIVVYGSGSGGLTSAGRQLFSQSSIGNFTNVAGDKFGDAMY